MHITINQQNNTDYELLLDDLIQEVFGFSFMPWFEQKLWDSNYESYSIIQNGKMLSNVCIYKTDMLISGKIVRAHQFGAVATRNAERKNGLSRLLMEHVLALYPDTPSYLYANPSVIDFYPRFGFRQVQTYQPTIAAAINNPTDTSAKYDPDDDFVREMLHGKRIHSAIVDCTNTQSVQIFNLLMEYDDGIHHLPGCDALIIAEQNDSHLFLADVIASKPLSFDALKQELPFTGIESIAFGFCPDWLGISPHWEPVDMDDELFFLRGDWELPQKFCFPTTSRT